MRRRNKKGQAAMEFLMTYGWAILVVLAAIGALAYFGVLDIANFLPKRCAFPAGFDCIGDATINASNGYVSFVVANNHGNDVNITNIRSPSTDDDCAVNSWGADSSIGTLPALDGLPLKVENNQKATVRVNCGSGVSEGRFKGDFIMDYVDSNTGLTLQADGEIRGKAST